MKEELLTELSALRMVFNQDTQYIVITPKQVGALNALISKAIENADNRLPILRLITGIKNLDSSKQLTMHTATTLIDLLKEEDSEEWEISDYGAWLIETCENEVKIRPSYYKGRGGFIRNEAHMPDLFETDS